MSDLSGRVKLHDRAAPYVLAKNLGAHVYIDTAVDDAVEVLQRMGGARAILATAPSGAAMGPLVPGLAARGKLIVVGVPQDPDPIECVPFGLWRALNLRLTSRHGDRYGGLTGLFCDLDVTPNFQGRAVPLTSISDWNRSKAPNT